MYRPRIRVPLFGYFLVAAPLLMGLLLAAEAMLGPPGPMPLSTEAPVMQSKPAFAARTAPVVTPGGTISIVPVLQQPTFPTPAVTTTAAASREEASAAKKVTRKKTKVARPRHIRDRYAYERRYGPFGVW